MLNPVFSSVIKGTIPPCSKLFFIPKLYVKRFSTFHWSCCFFFKYCVTCKKSTLEVLINFGFVTSFELTVITFCFSDTFMAHNLYSGFAIQNTFMSTVVLFQWSKWSIATSLSPKCYSANVPLDFCSTADFEIKYFSTKTLLAFWVIPNWFSKFCRQNGYLNSKLMLRWDSHFKHKIDLKEDHENLVSVFIGSKDIAGQ